MTNKQKILLAINITLAATLSFILTQASIARTGSFTANAALNAIEYFIFFMILPIGIYVVTKNDLRLSFKKYCERVKPKNFKLFLLLAFALAIYCMVNSVQTFFPFILAYCSLVVWYANIQKPIEE